MDPSTLPFLQFGAFGLLAVVLTWVGKAVVTRILDQSFEHQRAAAETQRSISNQLTASIEKLSATLDRINERDHAHHTDSELRSQKRATDAELAAERRHGEVLQTIEKTAKETRHSLRNALTAHRIDSTDSER